MPRFLPKLGSPLRRWSLPTVALVAILAGHVVRTTQVAVPESGPAVPANAGPNAVSLQQPLARLSPFQATPSNGANGLAARTAPDPQAVALARSLRAAMGGIGAATTSNAANTATAAAKVDPALFPRPAKFSPAQQTALSRLRWQSGKQLDVRGDPDNGTIRFLEGLSLEPAAQAAQPGLTLTETTAENFLRRNGDLLLLNDPSAELQRVSRSTDDLGYTQVHYEQVYQGLRVWPASLTVQLDRSGNAQLLTGAYAPTPETLSVTPSVTSGQAGQIALGSLGASTGAPIEKQELIFYAPVGRATRLAYKVEAHPGPLSHWTVLVDARSGAVLDSINRVCTEASVGSGVDLGGQTRTLNLWSRTNRHFMIDTTKQMYDAVHSDPPNPTNVFGVIMIVDSKNVDPFTNPNQFAPELISSASTSSGFPAFGVSAAFNLSIVYDYYLARHQRNSIDGQGGTITAFANIPVDNAFWVDEANAIFLGNVKKFPDALDVMAHEMTHGVTSKTAGLVYMNQSGAMNEAFSDIFGECTEAYSTGGQPDWLTGSKLVVQSRSLKDPSSKEIAAGRFYPSKLSQFISADDPFLNGFAGKDQGGVHLNSSIINHAFYQLVEGLNGAIGLAKAERIFYRALTTKLQNQSQFIDCRLACVQSAVEIYGAGSVEAMKTGEAFSAVEIFDQAAPPAPTPIASVSGDDSLIFTFVDAFSGFTYLARREAAKSDPTVGTTLWQFPVAPNKKPAVVGNGSSVMVVSADNDIALVDTTTGVGQKLGYVNQVWSVGLSPDGLYAAIILRDQFLQPRNQINVITLSNNNVETYDLVASALDAGSIGTVLYGDTLDFSLDGGLLYYDALNRIQFSNGATVDNWSIYAIDRKQKTEFAVVKPIPGVNIGNPAIGQIHNDRLVFEADNRATFRSTVYAMNLTSGQIGGLFVINSSLGVAYPCLNGDDTSVLMSDYAFPNGVYQKSVIATLPLTADGLSPAGQASIYYDGNASGPVIGTVYRRGQFAGVPVIQVTAADAFASETSGDTAAFTVIRTGSTAAPLSVSFVLTGSAGNGTDFQNVPLTATIPAGSITTTVTVVPIADSISEGTETVTLSLSSASHYTLGALSSASATISDTAFGAWALAKGVSGEGGNEDGDDYANLMEFALGTNPKGADASGRVRGRIQTIAGTRTVDLLVDRMTNNPAVQYVVEVADTVAGPWNSGSGFTTVIENTQTNLTVRANGGLGNNASRFMRLKVLAQ